MKVYVYIGATQRIYPDIVTPAGSLVVEFGDEFEFDNPPADGLWIPADPKNSKGKA